MKWNEEQLPLVEAYSRGYAWICLYKEDEGEIENFKKVNERMMALETQMKEKGVTPEQIDAIVTGVNKILEKKTGEMSDRELLFVNKVIWGKDTKFSLSMPKGTDLIFVNGQLVTYTFYMNHKEEIDNKLPEETVDKVSEK